LNRNYFNTRVWKPGQAQVGIEQTRDNGMHALRHWYASVLLDAGEWIRAVSEYLGHSDPEFTLRTYTHLMPTSAERTRAAVDGAFATGRAEDSNQDIHGNEDLNGDASTSAG
jgi:integrase